MEKNKPKIFLSYCWRDDKIADDIQRSFTKYPEIIIERDKTVIEKWRSIRTYMKSITDMDYVMFLISRHFLESENCMYEVLEVMKDRNYREKIFPVIIDKAIYNIFERNEFIKYWQEQYDRLEKSLQGIRPENRGHMSENLRHYKNIQMNLGDFLEAVTDMNNPDIKEVAPTVYEELGKMGRVALKSNIPKTLMAYLDIEKDRRYCPL